MSQGLAALAAPAVFAALGGWVAGAVSARVTLSLSGDPGKARSLAGWLALDPLVQVILAVAWAALLFRFGPGLRWAAAALLAVPPVQVGVTDFRTRYVYTAVPIVGTIAGLALVWFIFEAPWWTALAGAAGGLVLFLVLYEAGRLLYRGGEPLARGDIYIGVMVGAITGPQAASSLVLGILLGGLLALVYLAVLRSRKAFMPYGPGLCVAALVALLTA